MDSMRKKGEEKKGTGKEDRSAKKGKDVWNKGWQKCCVVDVVLCDVSKAGQWKQKCCMADVVLCDVSAGRWKQKCCMADVLLCDVSEADRWKLVAY
jgi:hypothetical protein